MSAPSATAVIDLQFGSTGKGSMAAWLGQHGEFDSVVTAWGPNAGHTSVYEDGTECVRTMLSNAAFRSDTIKLVFIGPGSMINPQALVDEYADTIQRGNQDIQLVIHESAAVVLDDDRKMESGYGFQIGSTMKGTAEAVMRKMRRVIGTVNPGTIGEFVKAFPDQFPSKWVVPHAKYLRWLYSRKNVLLEGCQGYSLGINSGFWPHTTSRECTVAQLLSDTLMPIHSVENVIGVARTYPIRVANRYDVHGKQIGTSGPCYADQQEITWESLGREPELTTVTKLPRRIFTFSQEQLHEAIARNSVNSIFMNFMNYLPEDGRESFVQGIEDRLNPGTSIDFFGHGPKTTDIVARNGWEFLVAGGSRHA